MGLSVSVNGCAPSFLKPMSLVINGELLKSARLRRGLSLASWARELMVSETQLRSLEEGSERGFYNANHRAQIAQKYATVLGVDLASLHQSVPPRPVPASAGEALRSSLKRSATHHASDKVNLNAQDLSMALARAHEGTGDLWRGRRRTSRQARIEYWLAGVVLFGLAVWFSVDAWKHHRKGQTSDPILAVQQRLDDPPSALNARPVEMSQANKVELAGLFGDHGKRRFTEYRPRFVGGQIQALHPTVSASDTDFLTDA
ncbi:MAG: XRE family transcriptional regulator [Betaproteobacteria bacterium]|nr:XRE family transcriptional regulator [Betaproteobacteria bacterium]